MRGFRESRLGPKDQFGNPYGGNLRVTSQNELILPMPAKWRPDRPRQRCSSTWATCSRPASKLKFYGPDGMTPVDYNFSVHRT